MLNKLKLLLGLTALGLAASAYADDGLVTTYGADITGKTLTKATEIRDGHHYLIWDNTSGRSGYHYATSNGNGVDKDTHTSSSEFSPEYVWTANAVFAEDGTTVTGWKFLNEGHHKYLTKLTWASNTGVNGDKDAVFTYTQTGGTFHLVDIISNLGWDGNSGNLAGWSDGGQPSCHPIFLYDLADNDIAKTFDYREVTYKYPAYKTHPNVTKKVIIPNGSDALDYFPTSHPDFFTATGGVNEENTIVSGTNREFNIPGSWSYPIEANNVYRMRLRPSADDSKYMHFDGNEANLNYTDVQETDFSTDFFWYFKAETMTEDGFIPVTIHSMSMTADQGLEFDTDDNSIGSQSLTPTVWYIRPTTAANTGERDFVLQHTGKNGDKDVFINYRDGKVSTWSTTFYSAAKSDAGCVFRAYDLLASDWAAMSEGGATEEEINDAKANPTVDNVRAIIRQMSVPEEDVTTVIAAGDYIVNTLGLGSAADIEEWNDFKAEITDKTKVNPARYALLTSAVNSLALNASLHIPAEGKPMRFRHVKTSTGETVNYLGINAGNLRNNAETGKSIFTLKPVPENSDVQGFYLYNEYADKYLNFPSSLSDTPTTVYILDMYSDFSNPTFGIRNASGTGNIFVHNNGSNNNIVASVKNEGSEWKLEAATAEQASQEHLNGKKDDLAGSKALINGPALYDLGVNTAAAKEAWDNALEAYNATPTAEKIITLLNAYEDLKKNIMDGVSINARHKACNRDYIGVNPSTGDIYCPTESGNVTTDGTRALTLEMSADGRGFNIFSEYAGKYITHPIENNKNVGLTPDKSAASIYTFDVNYASADNISFAFCCVNTDNNLKYFNTNDQISVVTRWNFIDGQGNYIDGSSWYLNLVTEDVAANEYLAGGKAAYNRANYNYTDLGQYSPQGDAKIAVDNALATTESASIDEKRAAGNTLRNPELTINPPLPGHIYMFSNIACTKYMSSDNKTNTFATMVDPEDANLLSRLFYIDEDYHLVALTDGKVMGAFSGSDKGTEGHSWTTVLLSNTEKVGIFTFSGAATTGKYVIAAQGSGRNMYNAHDDVDCGGGPGGEGYHWTIEERDGWIPVPGTDVSHTTYYMPVALIRRPGMTFYTLQVQDNGKVLPVEFTDNVIPANVPFMLDLADNVERNTDNHLVYLQKTSDEGNVPAGNILQGSIYAQNNATCAVRSTSGYDFATTDAVVNGFTAYLPQVMNNMSNPVIEKEISNLVGKVFAIRNVEDGRGYLMYKEGENAIWASAKADIAIETAATGSETDSRFHWTLIEHEGRRYLYNIAAGKYAAAHSLPGTANAGSAEFAWVFSDYPTAIDFNFLGWSMTENIESAKFNILGGENTSTDRPAGMMIIKNNSFPVPCISGATSNTDGCGFRLIIIEDATPGEVASVDEALEAMEADHVDAIDYIDNHNEDHYQLPGHYNTDGYAAFRNALQNPAADTQGKYYQLVRARNAAANNINNFVDGGIYVFDGIYANSYILPNKKFYFDVEETSNGTPGSSNVWICSVDENGKVNFSHTFNGFTGYTQVDKPAAVRARFATATNDAIDVPMFNEAVTPTYKNGYGDIETAEDVDSFKKNLNVASLASENDLVTTGITEVTAADATDSTVYDLQGRRVSKTGRGLYIVNGKKAILK